MVKFSGGVLLSVSQAGGEQKKKKTPHELRSSLVPISITHGHFCPCSTGFDQIAFSSFRLAGYQIATMGTGKKEATRRVRQGKTGDGLGNVRTKGENFYRYVCG
jgi:hypothetical protein